MNVAVPGLTVHTHFGGCSLEAVIGGKQEKADGLVLPLGFHIISGLGAKRPKSSLLELKKTKVGYRMCR